MSPRFFLLLMSGRGKGERASNDTLRVQSFNSNRWATVEKKLLLDTFFGCHLRICERKVVDRGRVGWWITLHRSSAITRQSATELSVSHPDKGFNLWWMWASVGLINDALIIKPRPISFYHSIIMRIIILLKAFFIVCALFPHFTARSLSSASSVMKKKKR